MEKPSWGEKKRIHKQVGNRVPEPDVLRLIGEESRRHSTDKPPSAGIDRSISSARKRLRPHRQ